MTNIYERFKALPRARKGATTVVIVEEQVLAELVTDAQIAERARTSQFFRTGDGASADPTATAVCDHYGCWPSRCFWREAGDNPRAGRPHGRVAIGPPMQVILDVPTPRFPGDEQNYLTPNPEHRLVEEDRITRQRRRGGR